MLLDLKGRLVIDQAKGPKETLLKEAPHVHIQMTSTERSFNHDKGLELARCWIVTLKARGGGVGTKQFPTLNHMHLKI